MASFDIEIEADLRLITLYFAPLPDINEIKANLQQLWTDIRDLEAYDFINDFRGMTRAPSLDSIKDSAEFWSQFLQDSDAFQITALVINDPAVRIEAAEYFRDHYSQRYIGAFGTMEEAREWIRRSRRSYLAAKS